MYIRRRVERLPPADSRALARSNRHVRDDLVRFDEEEHVYYVLDTCDPGGGDAHASQTYLRVERSVSGLIKVFLPELFDGESHSARLSKRARHDSKSPYYWLLQAAPDQSEEGGARLIREAWRVSGSRTAEYGTFCHLQLERAMNSEVLTDSDRNAHVRAGLDWIAHQRDTLGWIPFRTEWSLFMDMRAEADGEDCDAPHLQPRQNALLCGQLDALFMDPEGGYHLVDYKFTKPGKLDPDDGAQFAPGKKVPTGLYPLDAVPNNSYGHYLFQQSCYAYMLKRRYGIVVRSSRLLHIPVEKKEESAAIIAREIPLNLLPDATMRTVFVEAMRKI